MTIKLANGSITVNKFQSAYQGEMVQVIASREIEDSYFGWSEVSNLWEQPATQLEAVLVSARNFVEAGA
jgi:hypothetical protein